LLFFKLYNAGVVPDVKYYPDDSEQNNLMKQNTKTDRRERFRSGSL